jgi:hypothetical protein
LIVNLIEFFFHVRLDGAVRGRVRNASQHEAVAGLVVVQEGLVGLVDGTRDNLTRAGGARARSAGVRQVNASFFSRVEDVRVVGAFNLLGAFRGFQSDREVHDGHASLHFLLWYFCVQKKEKFFVSESLGFSPAKKIFSSRFVRINEQPMDFSSSLLLHPRALSVHPRFDERARRTRSFSRTRTHRISLDLFFTFDAFLNPREG